MSVSRAMHPVTLQKKEKTRTASGAEKKAWKTIETIDAAIWKTNELLVTESLKYGDSSHTGLTHCKTIKSGLYRILDGDTRYQVIDVNTESRLTNLLLKAVDTDV